MPRDESGGSPMLGYKIGDAAGQVAGRVQDGALSGELPEGRSGEHFVNQQKSLRKRQGEGPGWIPGIPSELLLSPAHTWNQQHCWV